MPYNETEIVLKKKAVRYAVAPNRCCEYSRPGGSVREGAGRGYAPCVRDRGLTAVMTAISAVHWKAARALFRFRKSSAAG